MYWLVQWLAHWFGLRSFNRHTHPLIRHDLAYLQRAPLLPKVAQVVQYGFIVVVLSVCGLSLTSFTPFMVLPLLSLATGLLVVVGSWVIGLRMVLLTASAMTHETTERTWPLLRLTPFTSAELLLCKLSAAITFESNHVVVLAVLRGLGAGFLSFYLAASVPFETSVVTILALVLAGAFGPYVDCLLDGVIGIALPLLVPASDLGMVSAVTVQLLSGGGWLITSGLMAGWLTQGHSGWFLPLWVGLFFALRLGLLAVFWHWALQRLEHITD